MKAGLLAVLAAALLLPASARAQSTGTATVTITVTPGVTRSLSLALTNAATYYDLGLLSIQNQITVGTTPFIVSNTGNISVTYSLQISSESDPSPGGGANPIAAPGYPWSSIDAIATPLNTQTDKYRLFAMFHSTASQPVLNLLNDDTHLVKKANARLAGTVAGQFASVNANGANVTAVPGQNERGLYFALEAPQYTTTNSSKRIGVTVVAQ